MTQPPEEREECDNCSYAVLKTDGHRGAANPGEPERFLCRICCSTYLSYAFDYPRQFSNAESKLMKSLAWIANELLSKLQRLPKSNGHEAGLPLTLTPPSSSPVSRIWKHNRPMYERYIAAGYQLLWVNGSDSFVDSSGGFVEFPRGYIVGPRFFPGGPFPWQTAVYGGESGWIPFNANTQQGAIDAVLAYVAQQARNAESDVASLFAEW